MVAQTDVATGWPGGLLTYLPGGATRRPQGSLCDPKVHSHSEIRFSWVCILPFGPKGLALCNILWLKCHHKTRTKYQEVKARWTCCSTSSLDLPRTVEVFDRQPTACHFTTKGVINTKGKGGSHWLLCQRLQQAKCNVYSCHQVCHIAKQITQRRLFCCF